MNLIPVEALEVGRLYRIRSRNLSVGVWTGDKYGGFIGIREKFGHEYLFTEYHRDTGGHHGTVTQMEATEHTVPEGVPISEEDNKALFEWMKPHSDEAWRVP